ncbi:hypothetical protein [Cellulomonas sp. URHD0024]|uniref:hypothetical protein n=1 Tax=Cellulomonas sp. URHD0024 TaxID=1302620 RepID=UPI0012DFDD3E|nr:hypothetical protein [Cellulomonas sp. URHD0024]
MPARRKFWPEREEGRRHEEHEVRHQEGPPAAGKNSIAKSADRGRLVRQRTVANTGSHHAGTDDAELLAQLEGFEPATAIMRDRSAVAHIESAVHAKRVAEQDVEDAVFAARAAGVTWTEIGAALGITHQGAIKRYGGR